MGRGVFELTGWNDATRSGTDVVESLELEGFDPEKNPATLALEWGVRRLDEMLDLRTRAGPSRP